MKKEYEEKYHQLEETHWWFQGRRHLVRALVRRCVDGVASDAEIDISVDGIELCQQRGLTDTHVMDAQKLSFGDERFDVITASDVLEHLADARQAVREWRRVLKPGGVLIVFVPAFQFHWSEHDQINKHFKRYRGSELRQLLAENGFVLARSSYWNFLLFWPVAIVRLIRRLRPKREAFGGDIRPAPALLNRALTWLLRFENSLLLRGLNYPVGVSVLAMGRKPAARN